MALIACLVGGVACSGGPAASIDAGPPDAAPPPVPADAAPPAATVEVPILPRTVIGRLVGGDEVDWPGCGTFAWVGVYVYEVVGVVAGPPMGGRIVVDVLCPGDMARGAGFRFARGELHQITLGPARLDYASTRPRPSPEPDALRFEAVRIVAPEAR
jgi:hypothetical protein